MLHTSGVTKLGHTGAHALATRGGAPPVQVSMQIISMLLITNRVLNGHGAVIHRITVRSSPLAQAGIDARAPFFSRQKLY